MAEQTTPPLTDEELQGIKQRWAGGQEVQHREAKEDIHTLVGEIERYRDSLPLRPGQCIAKDQHGRWVVVDDD